MVLKWLYIPSKEIYQHLWFKGVFNVQLDKDKDFKIVHYGDFLENQLFWDGIYGFEHNSTRLWQELSKNSNTIFDIGANTGIYTLIAKTTNSNANIYAFEPVKRIYK